MTLAELAAEAALCTKCSLSKTRTQVVFGTGSENADLMFVGEAPGFHEDKQGIPFVGQAGQLLNEVLASIGLERKDVYIANVLMCRPPNNRDPLPNEIESCHPWLLKKIELIDPTVICSLGNFATRLLLNKQVGITRVRGQRFTYQGRVLIPTFHPAAVLHGGGRGGDQFHLLEQDLKLVRTVIDELSTVESTDAEQLGLF
ncbi:MAG: uracil-DNA glycosylase [Actinomycetota bacterium]